ncbi:MAG TPA: type II/IV secretion system protein, partial [Cyanobacteria bacterium UBA11162]|nr:type II/IV secretion system protein [Cyanobacteria bacterium UBA11162]
MSILERNGSVKLLPNLSLTSSVWQQLKNRKITCEQALNFLVDEQGTVNLDQLDPEVTYRFFRQLPNRNDLPPVIPLLLWRGCYYLGSPVSIKEADIQNLSDRTLTNIKIIPITEKSYRAWHLTQTFNGNGINSTSIINPITGESEPENITETTEIYLKKASDQITRIKTIISGALRNRASDIHLEPTPEGLRVRYRIDGILRDITTLPLDISRSCI